MVVFILLPVGRTKALPNVVTVPVDSFILEPRTLTNALGLKPTSENAAEAKGVAPKEYYYYQLCFGQRPCRCMLHHLH